jgi:hypothetical protein
MAWKLENEKKLGGTYQRGRKRKWGGGQTEDTHMHVTVTETNEWCVTSILVRHTRVKVFTLFVV